MHPLQRVRFNTDIVTLIIRPPRRHEQDTLESFECHASACVTCYQLMSPPSAAVFFCAEGRCKATSLRHLLYAERGRIYAFPREHIRHRVIVEIHPVFRIARNMLCAMDRSRPYHEHLWNLPGPKVPARACLRPISKLSASRCLCSICSMPTTDDRRGYGCQTHPSLAGSGGSTQRHGQDQRIPDVVGGYQRRKVDIAKPERIWVPHNNGLRRHQRGEHREHSGSLSRHTQPKRKSSNHQGYIESRETSHQTVIVNWD